MRGGAGSSPGEWPETLVPHKQPHKDGSPAFPCLQSRLTRQDPSPEETSASAQKQTDSSPLVCQDLQSNPTQQEHVFFQSRQRGSAHGSIRARGPALPCGRSDSPSSRGVTTSGCSGAGGQDLLLPAGCRVLRGPSLPPSLPAQTRGFAPRCCEHGPEVQRNSLMLHQRRRKSPSDPSACLPSLLLLPVPHASVSLPEIPRGCDAGGSQWDAAGRERSPNLTLP